MTDQPDPAAPVITALPVDPAAEAAATARAVQAEADVKRAAAWITAHSPAAETLAARPGPGTAHLTAEPDAAAAILAAADQLQTAASKLRAARDAAEPRLVVYRWVCPYCTHGDMGPDQGRCLNCVGTGLTNDIAGWDEDELTEAPVPPGVMRSPCPDCALRPGSPESEDPRIKITADRPFWCHHGCTRSWQDGNQPIGTYRPPGATTDLPLGELLCAGWWALAAGRPLPSEPYREPSTRKDT